MWKIFNSIAAVPQPAELSDALSVKLDQVCADTSVVQHIPEMVAVDQLDVCDDASDRIEDLRCCLQSILRYMDQAREGIAPYRQNAVHLLRRLLASDAPGKLLACSDSLDFEAQKDAMRLFNVLLVLGRPLGAEQHVVDYIRSHPRILVHLLEGSGRKEVFTNCANMLRSCMRYPQLIEELFSQGAAERLIRLATHLNFDVASEAFASLRELLLAQRSLSTAYIKANFKNFFHLYHSLIQGDDYVTQRQALKLLGEILLDRACMEVMLSYISSEQYLQIYMNLLRENSRAIQLDAFHIFKVFVANPHKAPRVQQILYRNKVRLIKVLESFRDKHKLDDTVVQDLQTVVAVLQALEVSPRSRAPPVNVTDLESEQGIMVA